MSIELYIVRHGESTLQEKIQTFDCELSRKGRRQAKTAARRLRDLKFIKVSASDQKRAEQTAGIILGKLVYHPRAIEYSADLRERDFAHMKGMTYEEACIADIPAEELYVMDRGDLDVLYDVETLDQIRKRTSGIRKRILKAGYPKSLIVAHEWILSYLINQILEEDISAKTFHPQHNCAISYFKLNEENGKVLEYKIAQDEI